MSDLDIDVVKSHDNVVFQVLSTHPYTYKKYYPSDGSLASMLEIKENIYSNDIPKKVVLVKKDKSESSFEFQKNGVEYEYVKTMSIYYKLRMIAMYKKDEKDFDGTLTLYISEDEKKLIKDELSKIESKVKEDSFIKIGDVVGSVYSFSYDWSYIPIPLVTPFSKKQIKEVQLPDDPVYDDKSNKPALKPVDFVNPFGMEDEDIKSCVASGDSFKKNDKVEDIVKQIFKSYPNCEREASSSSSGAEGSANVAFVADTSFSAYNDTQSESSSGCQNINTMVNDVSMSVILNNCIINKKYTNIQNDNDVSVYAVFEGDVDVGKGSSVTKVNAKIQQITQLANTQIQDIGSALSFSASQMTNLINKASQNGAIEPKAGQNTSISQIERNVGQSSVNSSTTINNIASNVRLSVNTLVKGDTTVKDNSSFIDITLEQQMVNIITDKILTKFNFTDDAKLKQDSTSKNEGIKEASTSPYDVGISDDSLYTIVGVVLALVFIASALYLYFIYKPSKVQVVSVMSVCLGLLGVALCVFLLTTEFGSLLGILTDELDNYIIGTAIVSGICIVGGIMVFVYLHSKRGKNKKVEPMHKGEDDIIPAALKREVDEIPEDWI